MILFMILQSKVSTALKWGGKQNTLSFTTNLATFAVISWKLVY